MVVQLLPAEFFGRISSAAVMLMRITGDNHDNEEEKNGAGKVAMATLPAHLLYTIP